MECRMTSVVPIFTDHRRPVNICSSLITTNPAASCMEQGTGCFVSLCFPRICSGFLLAVLSHGLVSGVCAGALLDATSFPPPLHMLRSGTSFIAADKICWCAVAENPLISVVLFFFLVPLYYVNKTSFFSVRCWRAQCLSPSLCSEHGALGKELQSRSCAGNMERVFGVVCILWIIFSLLLTLPQMKFLHFILPLGWAISSYDRGL